MKLTKTKYFLLPVKLWKLYLHEISSHVLMLKLSITSVKFLYFVIDFNKPEKVEISYVFDTQFPRKVIFQCNFPS